MTPDPTATPPTLREAAQAVLVWTDAYPYSSVPIDRLDHLRAALAAGDGEQSRLRRLREWASTTTEGNPGSIYFGALSRKIHELLAEQPEPVCYMTERETRTKNAPYPPEPTDNGGGESSATEEDWKARAEKAEAEVARWHKEFVFDGETAEDTMRGLRDLIYSHHTLKESVEKIRERAEKAESKVAEMQKDLTAALVCRNCDQKDHLETTVRTLARMLAKEAARE